MFRKVIAVAGVTALTLLSGTILQPVEAGGLPGVYGTEWTQIANNIELGNINVQTLSQLAQAIQQTTTMLQQAKTMDIQLYSDVFGDIKAVEQVVQAGQGLAYTMGDMDSQWNLRYQLNGTQQPNNYSQQYQTWASTSMDTTRGTLKAVTAQGGAFQSDAQMVTSLQNMAKNSVGGSLQAEQGLLQIVAQQLGEQQKLRQLMLADLTAKQAYQAQQEEQAVAGQKLGQMPAVGTGTLQIDQSAVYPDNYLQAIGQHP
jgi:P-type conjugative transfer protein TrbJ